MPSRGRGAAIIVCMWPFCCSLFLFLMAALALQAAAQPCGAGAQAAMATHRPQVTSSSLVVPCGSLQFENGSQETRAGGQRGFDFPETSVRLGMPDKTELRLGVPGYSYNDDTSFGFANGFSDLTIGFKKQLGPALGGFEISVVPAVSIPTGSKPISSHGYDPMLELPWSHAIGKDWIAAGMFSLSWPTEAGRRNLTGQSSFYIDHQILSPFDAYVENSGAYPRQGGPQHLIDFGAAYRPSPHQQLDFHCGFGLSAVAPDYTVGFGYSVRFQITALR